MILLGFIPRRLLQGTTEGLFLSRVLLHKFKGRKDENEQIVGMDVAFTAYVADHQYINSIYI